MCGFVSWWFHSGGNPALLDVSRMQSKCHRCVSKLLSLITPPALGLAFLLPWEHITLLLNVCNPWICWVQLMCCRSPCRSTRGQGYPLAPRGVAVAVDSHHPSEIPGNALRNLESYHLQMCKFIFFQCISIP